MSTSGSSDEYFSAEEEFVENSLSSSSSSVDSNFGLEPYRFEPIDDGPSGDSSATASSAESIEVDEDEDEWCECEKCRPMESVQDRICCANVPNIVDKLEEGKNFFFIFLV